MTRARNPLPRALAIAGIVALTQAGCGPSVPQPGALPGDPRAGLSLYKYAGCAQCHALSGVSVGSGPAGGPALDGEAGRRTAAWLETFLAPHIRRAPAKTLSGAEQHDLVAYLLTLH